MNKYKTAGDLTCHRRFTAPADAEPPKVKHLWGATRNSEGRAVLACTCGFQGKTWHEVRQHCFKHNVPLPNL